MMNRPTIEQEQEALSNVASKASMRDIKFTIPLAPITKKNSQRIVRCGKFTKILPSKAYEQYEKDVGYFLQYKGANIEQPCEVQAIFYMPTRRKVDLTNLLEALDDVLVKYSVLKDDNSKIIVSHDGSRVLHDPKNSRTEVIIHFL
jgi:Holliday junction resolvase RusA-like endonuclease